MKYVAIILLWPFYIILKVLQAFSLGTKGFIYCKRCNEPVHINNSIEGHCSYNCLTADDFANGQRPEWSIFAGEDYTPIKLPVYVDQNGALYLEDHVVPDDPHLRQVGNDGYRL